MAKHRTYSMDFKRQVALEFLGGETLHELGKRHDTSRNLIRIWVAARYEACAPYRARTKGKDENGVRYVKRNAIAVHPFESFGALEAHLVWWMREIADQRQHGTTGATPLARFEREAQQLAPCAGQPPFGQLRDLIRTVHADCAVTVDTSACRWW